MYRARSGPLLSICLGAVLAAACQDTSRSPSSQPEPPRELDAADGGLLAPVDLVYVCGSRFLATNATLATVHVTYRVAGTDETGGLTLAPGVVDEDPGHSETEFSTRKWGVVELYLNGERLVRRRNQGLPCGPAPSSALMAATGSESMGEWTAPFAWPVVALHLSLLPNGRLLSWGLMGSPYVWDPATGNSTAAPSPVRLFCSGHSLLADGRLLVSGGHISMSHGVPDNTIFSPATESWSRSSPMRRGRWYPTNTTLGNGEVVIISGKDQAGIMVDEPEVWSSGSVRQLSTARLMLPFYPRSFLAPNGQVFVAGPSPVTQYLDPRGTGSWTPVGRRLYGSRDYGAAVMYDVGKILYVGGGRTTNTAEIIDLNSAPVWRWTGSMAYPRRHLNATVLPNGEVLVTGGSSGTGFNDDGLAVHAAEIWNPTSGIWRTLARNVVRRTYHATSILLPDGRVLHAGSGDGAGGPPERNAELFSPPYLFQGPRPTIAAAPSVVGYGVPFTVLTSDAAGIAKVSLIRLGSTTHAFDMNQRFQWLSFEPGEGALNIAAPTSRDRTPPGHYMLFILDGNGVPSVAKIVQVGSGTDPLPDPPPPPPTTTNTVRLLTAIGRASATRQDMTLTWTGARGARVDIYRNGRLLKNTPNDGRDTNGRLFTAAATYIFKVCEAGTITCSNPMSVRFGAGRLPPNVAPRAGFTPSCSSSSCTFTDASIDWDGTITRWQWSFGDGSSSTLFQPTHAYAASGTYTVTLRVTDDRAGTGTSSRQVTVVAAPPPPPPPVATTTTITGDTPDPSEPGATVTVSFRVSAAAGTPTGSVTVSDGVGSCSGLLSGGEGSCALVLSTVGDRTLTATYPASAGFGGSAGTAPHTVEAAPPPPPQPVATATTITGDTPDPSEPGATVTVSFTVSAAAGTPTGSVTVSDGVDSCSGPLSGGEGSCALVLSTVGDRTLTATYSGSADFSGSAGTAPHAVEAAPPPPPDPVATATTITGDSPDPSEPGATVTVSFTVSAAAGTPTGSVTVTDGVDSCSGPLSDGEGSCTLELVTVGARTLTATYSGNSSFNGSSDTAPHTVEAAPPPPPEATTTAITADSPDPSEAGATVTVSFTVSAAAGTPTGTVTVSDGVDSCSGTLSGGEGSCTLLLSTIGNRTLTATYSGNASFSGSSDTAPHTVEAPPPPPPEPTTTSITGDSPDPSEPGATVTVSFRVGAAAGTPTGSVTVSDGVVNCSGSLSGGEGSCTLELTSEGARTLTATYSGNSSFNGSSDTAPHTVEAPPPPPPPPPEPTTTSITGDSPDPSEPGAAVTVSFTVSAAVGTPVGSVSVSDGVDSCSAPLSGGEGSCALELSTVGNRTLTATYSGTAGFSESSDTAPHTVEAAPATP